MTGAVHIGANQWSFKHSALLEFGERDNHIDADEKSYLAKPLKCVVDAENTEPAPVLTTKIRGGFAINKEMQRNQSDIVCAAGRHTKKGIVMERGLLPGAVIHGNKIWKTLVSRRYLIKRNIHFYIRETARISDDEFGKYILKVTTKRSGGDEAPDENLMKCFYLIKAMNSPENKNKFQSLQTDKRSHDINCNYRN